MVSQRKRSWITKYRAPKTPIKENLDSPQEESDPPTLPNSASTSHSSSSDILLTDPSSRSPPSVKQLDQEASQLILNALERTNTPQSQPQPIPSLKVPETSARGTGSFGKMAFNSMMGGLSVLSLSRTSTNNSTNGDEKEKESRGRSMLKTERARSSSAALAPDTDASRSCSRARSHSPFSLRRFRQRELSPTPQPLPLSFSDAEFFGSSSIVQPQTAFADDPDSGDEMLGETDADTTEDDSSDNETLDPVTEWNTERNALIPSSEGSAGLEGDADMDPDPLGEGVNVIVPPEPYFPSSSDYSGHGNSGSLKGKKSVKRRKSTRHHEPLPLHTSRPIFQRDRCTIVLTQGDPEAKRGQRKLRTYVVASDMSEESRYAVEWGIGTVLRDGDELMIVNIVENESKGELSNKSSISFPHSIDIPVDPPIPSAADRASKLRCQQEVCTP